jgi:hypothetical protein
MEEENKGTVDTSVNQGEQDTNPEVEAEVETEAEDVDSLKAELAKAKELADNYKVRAEKAEKGKVKVETKPTTSKEPSLSTKDVIALAKADIDDEDVEEVMEYARFKKIPISEALKSSVIKATIAERTEMRKTAQATHTGATKKSGTKLTGDALVQKANKAEITSDDDFAAIWRARKGVKEN